MKKIILCNEVIFLSMMNTKQEIQQALIELIFFVLMLLKKVLEKVEHFNLLIIKTLHIMQWGIEFSVSGLEFSVFEKMVKSKEFLVSAFEFFKKIKK